MNKLRRSKGFTLIEIILVLAIAGLMLLAVLLALAGAQRARRDHERKQDLAQIVASIEFYASNHRGMVPTNQAEADDVAANYARNLEDPLLGTPYDLVFRFISSNHTDAPPVGTIYYQQGHWCNKGPESGPDDPGDPIAGNDANLTKFAAWTGLEGGGQNGGTWYCLDNL